jgi:hypothetical protein
MNLRTFTITAVAALAIAAPAAQGAMLGGESSNSSSSSTAATYYTPAALKAMGQRNQAMERYYGRGGAPSARPDDRGGVRGTGERPVALTASSSHPSNFSWGEAWLAGAAVLVVLALIGSRRITSLNKQAPSQSLHTS